MFDLVNPVLPLWRLLDRGSNGADNIAEPIAVVIMAIATGTRLMAMPTQPTRITATPTGHTVITATAVSDLARVGATN